LPESEERIGESRCELGTGRPAAARNGLPLAAVIEVFAAKRILATQEGSADAASPAMIDSRTSWRMLPASARSLSSEAGSVRSGSW
jgi:hypothetical protein